MDDITASLTRICVYPIKSTRPVSATAAAVEHCGLAGDRRWAIVDAECKVIRANICPAIMRITALPAPGGGLLLTAPAAPPLTVRPPSTTDHLTYVNPPYFLNLDRVAVGPPAAHAWLSGVLGQPVRLVWLDDPTRRPVPTEHNGEEGETVSLADDGPVHLMSTSTLRAVDEWVAAAASERGEPPPRPLDIRRFRPNIVVDGAPPFAEDGWKSIRVGEVPFRVCDARFRCVIANIDPTTLDRGDEPMRTLTKHRRRGRLVLLGILLVPKATGTIHLGDPVVRVDG